MIRPSLALPALALLLANCGKPPADRTALDQLDAQLTDRDAPANTRDPALTATLHDQIMVDPALAQQANGHALHPAPRPDPGAVAPAAVDVAAAPLTATAAAPAATATCRDCRAAAGALTLGALAERQPTRSIADCAPGIHYAAGWATRLPAALALPPGARVREAAGNDAGGCALRVVSFTVPAGIARLTDWYYGQASRAGFVIEHGAEGTRQTLGGTQGDAAFVLYLTPRGDGGTDADLVSNR